MGAAARSLINIRAVVRTDAIASVDFGKEAQIVPVDQDSIIIVALCIEIYSYSPEYGCNFNPNSKCQLVYRTTMHILIMGWTYELFKVYCWVSGQMYAKIDQDPLRIKSLVQLQSSIPTSISK